MRLLAPRRYPTKQAFSFFQLVLVSFYILYFVKRIGLLYALHKNKYQKIEILKSVSFATLILNPVTHQPPSPFPDLTALPFRS